LSGGRSLRRSLRSSPDPRSSRRADSTKGRSTPCTSRRPRSPPGRP